MSTSVDLIDNIFEVIKVIGYGYSSVVVLAHHRYADYNLAIKIYKQVDNCNLIYNSEIKTMKEIIHKNVIRIIVSNEQGIYLKGQNEFKIKYIGMEYVENYDLFYYISKGNRSFTEKMAHFIFKQLVEAVEHIHRQGVTHRDLKIDNILFDEEYNVKISDFGFAEFIDKKLFKERLGTKGYQPPEMLNYQCYDGPSSDIFSLGVTLFIMIYGQYPFCEATLFDSKYKYIYLEKYDEFWVNNDISLFDKSSELKTLITGMIKLKNRYTIGDIKKSKWYNQKLMNIEDYQNEMNGRKSLIKKCSEDHEDVIFSKEF